MPTVSSALPNTTKLLQPSRLMIGQDMSRAPFFLFSFFFRERRFNCILRAAPNILLIIFFNKIVFRPEGKDQPRSITMAYGLDLRYEWRAQAQDNVRPSQSRIIHKHALRLGPGFAVRLGSMFLFHQHIECKLVDIHVYQSTGLA